MISKEEKKRLEILTFFERDTKKKLVAGVDEAGRGPLAGPLVCVACIIKRGYLIPFLDDSKKLTEKKREALYDILVSDSNVRYAISIVDSFMIDSINIFKATFYGMKKAVLKLDPLPEFILVDGKFNIDLTIPSKAIVKGDQKSISIAAASIIAKKTRDDIMKKYDKLYPEYGFLKHKGYGTKFHRDAILKYGPCRIHRKSFEPLKSYLKSNTK